MNSEPVISANGIAAFVSAALVLLVSFGLNLSDEQKGAILGFVVIVAPLAAAWWARRKVTPLSDPKTVDGEQLVRASGDPTPPQARSAARSMAKG